MPWSKEEQKAWLNQVQEEILDPGRPIVDPHHHMWKAGTGLPEFLLNDLWDDTGSGHNIVKTVFMECGAEYLTDGPDHLRPVGETAFVAEAAKASRGKGKAEIAGIISHTDLTQDAAVIGEVLAEHEAAGEGLFRGIRHGGAHDPDKVMQWGDATPHPDLYQRETFRSGVRQLGKLGYTYDTWHYHIQNAPYIDLAKAAPDTQMILDHFGTPVFVGPYELKRDEIIAQWKQDIAEIAQCPNVAAKIGGLAMPVNNFGWNGRDLPASSQELFEAQRDFYLYTIDCFGPERCMFESNFPVDKMSLSYHVYWNAMKKIAASFSEAEQTAMFSGTASRVYSLD